MKRLQLGRFGLSTQMFLMIFALSMLVFVPASLISYIVAETKLEKRMTQDAFSLVNLTLNRINVYIDNAQNLMFSILAAQNLSVEGRDDLIAQYIDNYADNSQSVAQTIYHIAPSGKVISNRQIYYDIMGNPMLQTLAGNAGRNFGGLSWSQPYHSPLSGNTVAVVQPVESKSRENLGVLIVELNLSAIKNNLDRQLLERGRTYVLMTADGSVITMDRSNKLLPFVSGIYQDTLTKEAIAQLAHSPEGVSEEEIGGRDLIVVKSQRSRIDWVLCTVIDSNTFYTDLKSLANIQISASVIWVLVLLLFAIFISRHFSDPIRKLIRNMSSYQRPETAYPIPITRRDEIGQLADSYNRLLLKIKALVDDVAKSEKQKNQYELSMLQSQIQPHFLYNTLACISSLAKQNRIDEVRNTISSLVNLLSFTFNKTAEMVYLSEEVEAMQMYIQIQKVRYGDIFEIEYALAQETLSMQLPKLTLQPIIENAIFHGITPKRQKCGRISVRSSLSDGRLIIQITDNGRGMSHEKIEQLMRRKTDSSGDVLTHIGLGNVNSRIRLYYGGEYGISIDSVENEWTCVSVTLPAVTP